ncbi:Putative spermidine/putrescine transport system permease protein OS=Castellaniella defragrans OX=75697 GN=HNR28_003077 PE=3 SV=1 [Castellaniella defragrans]
MKTSRTNGASIRFSWLMLTPGLVFLAVFLVVPGFFMLALSLRKTDSLLNLLPAYGLSNYLGVLTSSYYLVALWTTLWVAVLTTVICVVLAYPAAWLLVKAPTRTIRALLYVILVSPLLTSVVIRTFAWIVLLARNGLVNDFLTSSGLADQPLAMLWNLKAVIIAYVQVMLPFAVLPIATSLGEVPEALPRASTSLGATALRTFWRITLPLTLPGMMTGAIIVFALAAGSYITPLLIGGRLQPLLPISIYQQTIQIGNLPLAAALSITLLIVTMAIAFTMSVYLRRWEKKTYGR